MPDPLRRDPQPPRPRIQLLDFIRLVAMILMVEGHTIEAFLNPGHMHLDAWSWRAWLGLRGLTAPLFLLVSGAASVLGVRYEADGRVARELIQRRVRMGLALIGLGYLMVFPANRLVDLAFLPRDIWRTFLHVNILQLNGITLLLLTALLNRVRTVRRYAAWSFGAGLAVLVVAPLVQSVDWFRWLPEPVGAYLSFKHGSLFPLFPSSAFMLLGVSLGMILKETPEPRRLPTFRTACLAVGVICFLLALGASWIPPLPLPRYDGGVADHTLTLLRIGCVMLIFSALTWFTEHWPRTTAAGGALGRKSLVVYVAHLVLLYGTPWTYGLASAHFHVLSLGRSLLFVPFLWLLTFGGVLLVEWLKRRSSSFTTTLHLATAIALAYALVYGVPALNAATHSDPGVIRVAGQAPQPTE